MAKKIFEEKQRFNGWGIIALLAFFIAALTFRFIEQNFISEIQNPMDIGTYLLFTGLLSVALVYFLKLRISIRITDKAISIKSFPFQEKRHKIKWEEVKDCEIIETPAIAQWNGWNISFSHEKNYSISGRNGVLLRTENGETVFVGSNKLKELREAVSAVLSARKLEVA